jgi:hypothetical protein
VDSPLGSSDRQAAEEDEELEFAGPVLALVALGAVVEPEEAGAAGVAAGVAEEPAVVVSDEAGVFVFSEPGAAAFSGESLPEPGFILSE